MGWEEPKDYEEGLATGEALVTISSGDGGQAISQSLYDAGVTKTPEAFYSMLIAQPEQPVFYPGVYRLQQKMTAAAALAMLQDPASKLENSALLPEGLTVEQTLTELSEGVGLPLADFQAAVADPAAYGVAGIQPRGLAVPRDVHVRSRGDRSAGHPDDGRSHHRVARSGRACPWSCARRS